MIDRRLLVLCFTAVACGGEKKPAPEGAAAMPPAAAEAPVPPASAVVPSKAPDSLSAKGTPAPAPQLRDSAFGPKFEVDERGNVKPIKRP